MPATSFPRTLMLLGSGELGKEVAIAAQRLGCRVIAVDRYPGAPAMQVADAAEVIAMTDPEALKAVVRRHRPDLLIPEIEALAVDALAELEAEGFTVIPTARATAVTMNRDRIRDLAAGSLGLRTARFAYAGSAADLAEAAAPLGWPVVVKPVMSSSGKGQSVVEGPEGITAAWEAALAGARGAGGAGDRRGVFAFRAGDHPVDREAVGWAHPVLPADRPPPGAGRLPVQLAAGGPGCQRPGHGRSDGPPRHRPPGWAGLFGVEFFLCGPRGQEEVVFSELSPRPHDTGLVTLRGQNLSEFDLHLRAVLGAADPRHPLPRRGRQPGHPGHRQPRQRRL